VTGGAPAMVLVCLVRPARPAGQLDEWARRLAPRVLVRAVSRSAGRLPDRPAGPLDGLPWAVLGSGGLGIAALDLATEATAAGSAPSQLIVCDCAPPTDPARVACPVTALASPGQAEPMTGWRSATTGGFTLRLLGGLGAPPDGAVSAEVVLALEEELAVWPY
jgi:hypothetical protein